MEKSCRAASVDDLHPPRSVCSPLLLSRPVAGELQEDVWGQRQQPAAQHARTGRKETVCFRGQEQSERSLVGSLLLSVTGCWLKGT